MASYGFSWLHGFVFGPHHPFKPGPRVAGVAEGHILQPLHVAFSRGEPRPNRKCWGLVVLPPNCHTTPVTLGVSLVHAPNTLSLPRAALSARIKRACTILLILKIESYRSSLGGSQRAAPGGECNSPVN